MLCVLQGRGSSSRSRRLGWMGWGEGERSGGGRQGMAEGFVLHAPTLSFRGGNCSFADGVTEKSLRFAWRNLQGPACGCKSWESLSPSPFPPPPPLPSPCGVCVCAAAGARLPGRACAGGVLLHLARPGEWQGLRHARDAQYLRLLISVYRAPARPAGLAPAAAAGVSCWRSPSRTNFRSGWGGGGWGRVARPGGPDGRQR